MCEHGKQLRNETEESVRVHCAYPSDHTPHPTTGQPVLWGWWGVPVVTAEGKRPDPSRTRKLSPPAPMVLRPTGRGRVGHRRNTRPPPHTSSPETQGARTPPGAPAPFRVSTRFSATNEIGVSTSAGRPRVGACLLLEWRRRRVGARTWRLERTAAPMTGSRRAGAPRNGARRWPVVRLRRPRRRCGDGRCCSAACGGGPTGRSHHGRSSVRSEASPRNGLAPGSDHYRHRETRLSGAEARRGGGARSGSFATCSPARCGRAPGVMARPRRRCCGATVGGAGQRWSPPSDATSATPISTPTAAPAEAGGRARRRRRPDTVRRRMNLHRVRGECSVPGSSTRLTC